MTTIPKRFIRMWMGPKQIPPIFDTWWEGFQEIHPDYEFITITDNTEISLPPDLTEIYSRVGTYAGQSDILRIIALYELGGIYIDTDVMPLRSFDKLLDSDQPFIGRRSTKSFESAVIGSPPKHKALKDLLEALPKWFYEHEKPNQWSVVQTGPAFISAVWFGREDVTHLPPVTFYPFNGFMAPKREEKEKMFADPDSFPEEMLCAHFSNHRWGGKPK